MKTTQKTKDSKSIVKNLRILQTKLFGKGKVPKGETILSLLGRD